MNTQTPEKKVVGDDGTVSVHSIFHTIQGEGPFCGTPCVFVRLAGCNLQCPACDTEYTEGRRKLRITEILKEIQAHRSSGLVVVTGGEPFRQHVSLLVRVLCANGFYVQVETNGTLAPPLDVQWSTFPDDREGAYIVCSPKTGSVHRDIAQLACCFKYVLSATSMNPEDGLPIKALEHSAHPQLARPPAGWKRPVYLQPMDAKDDRVNEMNLRACIASCMAHGYVLQLQLHKILGME